MNCLFFMKCLIFMKCFIFMKCSGTTTSCTLSIKLIDSINGRAVRHSRSFTERSGSNFNETRGSGPTVLTPELQLTCLLSVCRSCRPSWTRGQNCTIACWIKESPCCWPAEERMRDPGPPRPSRTWPCCRTSGPASTPRWKTAG